MYRYACGPCQHRRIFASAGLNFTGLLLIFPYVGLSWAYSSTTGEIRKFYHYEQYLLIISMIYYTPSRTHSGVLTYQPMMTRRCLDNMVALRGFVNISAG